MALYPCTQLAAQQELDRVLGKARLPSIEDKDALPQITAMFYEVLRCTHFRIGMQSGADSPIVGIQQYRSVRLHAPTARRI